MKKNILIFRSAKYDVIFSLIEYVLEKYNQVDIYIIVQKESIKILEDRYHNINYIINDDGFFKYKEYLKRNILREQVECRVYDEIYIPSSTVETSKFNEIQSIISEIKKKKTFFYNCFGQVRKINTNKYYLRISNKFNSKLSYILSLFQALLLEAIYYGCLIVSKFNIKNKEGTIYDE